MEGYQRAEEAAATELVRRASPALYRSFLAYTRNPSQAEDLLQETWIRVHKARPSYRPGSPPMPWLFAIAEHTRLDAYRKRERRQNRESALENAPEPSTGHTDAVAAKLTLHKLLATLPESQREVLVLLKIAGLSLEEVAQMKGCSVGAIKLKAHRAYHALRDLLGTKGGAA